MFREICREIYERREQVGQKMAYQDFMGAATEEGTSVTAISVEGKMFLCDKTGWEENRKWIEEGWKKESDEYERSMGERK